MNIRTCISILSLILVCIICTVDDVEAVKKQTRKQLRHQGKEGRDALSPEDFGTREEGSPEALYPEDAADPEEEEGGVDPDYLDQEMKEDPDRQEFSRGGRRRPVVHRPKGRLKGVHRSKTKQIEEEPVYFEEYDYPEDNEDYFRQISYNPDNPPILKGNERMKRLSNNEVEDGNESLDKVGFDNSVEGSDAAESENDTQSLERGNEMVENDKDTQQESVSSTKLSSRSPSVGEQPSIKKSDKPSSSERNGLVHKTMKKVEVLSIPKELNGESRITTPPSQGYKNLVELGRAFKLLVCASNRFVKIANKTLMDRLIEECATANGQKATSEACRTTTACPPMTNGPTSGDECCAWSSAIPAKSKESSYEADETEDEEDLLEITLKPKSKQGNSSGKSEFSWMQDGAGALYDSSPDSKVPQHPVDPGLYVYGDYDLDDEEDEQGQTTKSGAKVSSPPLVKVGSRSYEANVRAGSEDRSLNSKAVAAGKSKQAPTAPAGSNTTNFKQSSGRTQSPTTLAVPSGKGGKRQRGKKNHPKKKSGRAANPRRLIYNRKFLPLGFVKSVDGESATGVNVWKTLEMSLTTQNNEEADGLLPEQLYDEVMFGS